MPLAPPTLIPHLPLATTTGNCLQGAVRHVYVTSVGDGPRVLAASDALADAVTGLPLAAAAAGAADCAKSL